MSDYESDSPVEGEWEVVNTKAKKIQKAKQKKEEKMKDAQNRVQGEAEGAKRKQSVSIYELVSSDLFLTPLVM